MMTSRRPRAVFWSRKAWAIHTCVSALYSIATMRLPARIHLGAGAWGTTLARHLVNPDWGLRSSSGPMSRRWMWSRAGRLHTKGSDPFSFCHPRRENSLFLPGPEKQDSQTSSQGALGHALSSFTPTRLPAPALGLMKWSCWPSLLTPCDRWSDN